jgi:hypothetical protein
MTRRTLWSLGLPIFETVPKPGGSATVRWRYTHRKAQLVGSILKRTTSDGVRYDVRWRLADGTHRKRTFKRRGDAERYRRKVEGDEAAGLIVDPNSGEVPFSD